MTAAAVPVPSARVYDELAEAEVDEFQQALAAVLGSPAEAARASWMRRAVLMPDGEWRLAVRKPVEGLAEKHRDAPWLVGQGAFAAGGPSKREPDATYVGMASTTVFLPLAEGVELLKGDRNPETELARRRRLWDEAFKRQEDATEAHRAGLDAERRRAAEYKANRPQRWSALPREQRLLYVAAARVTGMTAQHALVELAKVMAASDRELAEAPFTFEEHLK